MKQPPVVFTFVNDILCFVDKITWNPDKNSELKELRKVTFEELLSSRLIAIEKHPKRKNQKIMLFEYKKYVWVVPYVQDKNGIFLKTAFQNRKYTKKYLGR